jgi:hypothetical protein
MKTARSSPGLPVYNILVRLLMLLHVLWLLSLVDGNAKHISGLHNYGHAEDIGIKLQ